MEAKPDSSRKNSKNPSKEYTKPSNSLPLRDGGEDEEVVL
jgi:hypothetical protein